MIVVDVETTGLNPAINALLSIGATVLHPRIDKLQQVKATTLDHSDELDFYRECRVYRDDLEMVKPEVFSINPNLRRHLNSEMPQPEQIVQEFIQWCVGKNDVLLAGENPYFDASFLKIYTDIWPFGYRYVDLHSIYWFITKQSMGLTDMAKLLLNRERGTAHNALEDAKLVRDCLIELLT